MVAACSGGTAPLVDAGLPDAELPDGSPPGCIDEDGDGAGLGTDCEQPDCDDTDPMTTDECGTGCDERPQRRGCACDAEPGTCYHGPDGTAGRGPCAAGLQQCTDGLWGTCEGQVLPGEESCNDLDDDCDGEADDGLVGECGVCGFCDSRCWGSDSCEPWTAGQSDRLAVTGEGNLALEQRIEEARVIWPATGAGEYGRIFQVDSATRQILGSYRRGASDSYSLRTGGQVDRHGDLYVSNPVEGGGSVMKIAHAEASCVDRNASGTIETSRSWDDALPFESEDSWEDECILWNTELPSPIAVVLYESVVDAAIARSLWVTLLDERRVVELDVQTGEQTGRSIETAWIPPQAATLDRQGRIWVGGQVRALGMFRPDSLEAGFETTQMPVTAQWLETDPDGWIWISGEAVYRFDDHPEELELVLQDELVYGPIAVDLAGYVWMVADMAVPPGVIPHLLRIDSATLEIVPIDLVEAGGTPMDVSVDVDGQAWVFNHTHGQGVTSSVVLDTGSLAVDLALDECDPFGCITAAGWANPSGVSSVIIGAIGVWTAAIEVCADEDDVTWTEVRTRAHLPAGSSIALMVRTGRSEAERDRSPWIELGAVRAGESSVPFEGTLGGDEPGRHHFMAVQARFRSGDEMATPELQRLEIVWGCASPVE